MSSFSLSSFFPVVKLSSHFYLFDDDKFINFLHKHQAELCNKRSGKLWGESSINAHVPELQIPTKSVGEIYLKEEKQKGVIWRKSSNFSETFATRSATREMETTLTITVTLAFQCLTSLL